MNIKKYEIDRPDSDGDCSIDLEFEVTSSHDEDIRQIKFDALHMTEDGYVIAADQRNSNECFLEKGDVEELRSWGRVHKRFMSPEKSATVRIMARLFKREFFKFGPFKVPESEGVEWISAKIDSQTLEDDVKISVARSAPDDDGEVRIDFLFKAMNKTAVYLESSEVKISMLDRAGAEIEVTSYTSDSPPHSASVFEPSFWGMKPKKIKGATLEISLTVHQEVGAETIEGSTKFPL